MKEDLYINFIYKQLSGEISPTEKGQLDDWLATSQENKETYRAVQTAWELSGEAPQQPDVDLDREFAALDQRISQEEKSTNRQAPIHTLDSKRPSNRRPWLAAAGFLLLILAAYFITTNLGDGNAIMIEIATTDQIKELQLPDGTKVVLNKNSRLSHPTAFTDMERAVQLNGEAFFEVVRDTKRPFNIEFDQSYVQVLGTSFNIRTGDQANKVSVQSGKVKWYQPDGRFEIILEAGDAALYDKTTTILSPLPVFSPNDHAWRTGDLIFDDAKLDHVLSAVERHFSVQFSPLSASLELCRFTGTFKNASLGPILESLTNIFNMEIKKVDETNYQLSGGTCQ